MKFHWDTAAIGEVAPAISRPEAPILGKDYRQIGVRLWGKGAYERESIDGGDTQYAVLHQVEKDDIIVNKIWARHGSVSVVSGDLAGCYCSNEFPLFRPDITRLLPQWFYWITKTRWFWKSCELASRGTTSKSRIKPAAFAKIEIPIPDTVEQERIATRMDEFAYKTKAVRNTRMGVEQEAEAFLRSSLSQITKDAPLVPMREAAPLTRRPVEIRIYGEYQELGVRSFGRGVFHKPTIYGADLTWQKLFRIQNRDVIFSNIKAWEGAIAVARTEDDGFVGSHRYLTCVPKDGRAVSSFICTYLLSREGLAQINKASPGSADRNRTLGQKTLAEILVPLPSYEDQMWFDQLCWKVSTLKAPHADMDSSCDAMIPSLLDRAFKGEL